MPSRDALVRNGDHNCPIAESHAHKQLLACATDYGLDSASVRDFLWRIRAPRDLLCLARIAARINFMLSKAVSVWHVDLAEYRLADWLAITKYISKETDSLTKIIGSDFNKLPISEQKNPLAGKELTHWAPYPTYWHDHERKECDAHYALLQAHLLVAFATDVRRYTSISEYENCEEPYFKLPRRDPYEASYAVRELSEDDDEKVECLSKLTLSVERPPFAFALWLRGTRYAE